MIRRFALATGLLWIATTGNAAPPSSAIDTALAEIHSDSVLISHWMTDQVRYAAPFNATSGNVVPSQIKLLGFEVGVTGGASTTRLDTSALHQLPTSVVSTENIDMLSRLPLPVFLGHAKIGLPFGFDLGVLGGGTSESYNRTSTHVHANNTIYGIDLRKHLIEEGVVKPFGLTLGLSFTHSKGSFESGTDYSSNGQVTVNGSQYNSALTAYGSNTGSARADSKTDWTTQSWGLQAIVDKQLFIVTPYIGGSIHRNFGTPSSSITTSGRETLSDGSGSTSTDFTTVGSANSPVNKWDTRLLGGLEFTPFPFFHIDLGGEYAGIRNITGNLGLRFQFP